MLLMLHQDQLAALRNKKLFTGAFLFLGTGFRLFSDNERYIESFKKIYERLTVEHLEAGYLTCYILDRCNFCTGSSVIIDTMMYEFPSGNEFIGHAEVILLQKVIDRIQSCFLIHAGVVSRNNNGYVIYAPSGFGKTTLVMELASRGYKFLSDEYCPIQADDLIIKPFARRVGIKSGSPFVRHVLQTPELYFRYADKYYVHCSDLFNDSDGKECQAKYFIMLTNENLSSIPAGQMQQVRIVLFDDTRGIIDMLRLLDGVTVSERYQRDYSTEYVLSIPRDRMVTGKVHAIIKQHEKEIYFVETVREQKKDFSNAPRIARMQKSEAVFEILANLINRSPSSSLLSQHADKHYNLLLKIGAFIKDVACYQLTTGDLREMANIIDGL